jgi:lysozyme
MAHHHWHHHYYATVLYNHSAEALKRARELYPMASYDPAQLFKQLGFEEGYRPKMYRDSRGNWTVGYGHNMSIAQRPESAKALYDIDIAGCEASLDLNWPWWRAMDPIRQLVMMDMMFNMGSGGLGTFKEFLAAMRIGDWPTAAKDMMESKWEAQVGERAVFLQEIILTGIVPAKRPVKG